MRMFVLGLVVAGLFVAAIVSFLKGAYVSGVAFLAGAATLGWRLFQGDRSASFNDADAVMDFVKNPAGAIAGEFWDRVTQFADERNDDGQRERARGTVDKAGEDESSFDADAAIARYLANRPAQAELPDPAPLRSAGGFGRKGL